MDFYALIREARAGSDSPKDPSADPERLRIALEPLSSADLNGFVLAFDTELIRLNTWELWDAGFVACNGMGDDAFHYFRSWIIGKGPRAVAQALTDPDGLVEFFDVRDLDNELLEYVAPLILLDRGGFEDPRRARGERADGAPHGVRVPEGARQRRKFARLASWAAEGARSAG